MTDCLICFCPIEGTKYGCGDPLCTAGTCKECTGYLITYSSNEGIIPECPSDTCSASYIISCLRGISDDILRLYGVSCLKHFLKDSGDSVKKKLASKKILAKLREERFKFIEKSFPAAIALVSSIAFNSKIRKLEKARQKRVNETMTNAHRHCLNSICKGFLDKDLTCLVCGSVFCTECEKLKRDNHECKEEDVASVKMVNEMIKCPGCKLPVFKNVGCDSITCSNCGTQFLYSTGQKGGHGSTNARIQFQEAGKISLSSNYRTLLTNEQLELLLKIEGHEPSVHTKDILLGPIRHYYKEIPDGEEVPSDAVIETTGKGLARKFDKYTRNRYHNRDYQRYLIEIEELIQKGELTTEHLLRTLNVVEKLVLRNSIRKLRQHDRTTANRRVRKI